MGTSALIIGANLPDVDVLAYLGGPLADLEWRRGWTHGVLAIFVLPLLLTGALALAHRALSRPPDSGLRSGQLLLLSFVAVLSHPILDTLNTYGVRWLMPFSGRWFYGDALFILDPWVWLLLAAGVLWTWHRRTVSGPGRHRPAQLALGAFGAYAITLWATGLIAKKITSQEIEAASGQPVLRAMAGPLPLTLLTRSYVGERRKEYVVGRVRLTPAPEVTRAGMRPYPRGRPDHPAYAVAETTLVFRRFLGWARFPTFSIEWVGRNEFLVHAVDLRYASQPGARFGSVSVGVRVPEIAE